MKIAIVTPGFLPIPAVKGGATENLIQLVLTENENNEKFDIDLLSIYDEEALEKSSNFSKTDFIYFKVGKIIKMFDKIVYFFANHILKKTNLISYKFIFSRVSLIFSYIAFLKKTDYDKIILVGNPSLFLILKSRRLRIKYHKKIIYWAHNEVKNLYGCEKYLSVLNKFIAVSNFVINKFNSDYNSGGKVPVYVIKNCIDIKKIHNIDETIVSKFISKYNINSNDKILLFTGRVSWEKGVKEVIDAFQIVHKKYQNTKLIIVGSNFYAHKIRDLYEENIERMVNCDDNIIMTGYVSYEKVFSLYSLADLAVLPSMWDEPAGMTMLELSLMGIPVITTDSGGIPEYIKEGAGIILKKENVVNQIVDAVSLLFDHTEMYKKISENGKAMEKNYTSKKYYEEFCHLVADE